MPHRPNLDLATALATALGRIMAPTSGANTFAGPVRPAQPEVGIPHDAIFVYVPGGDPVQQTFRRKAKIRQPIVMVHIRGDVALYGETEVIARSVVSALNNLVVLPVGGGGRYKAVLVNVSEPIQLPQNDTEHWEFMVPVEMTYDDG